MAEILLSTEGEIGIVTMSQPKRRNALTPDMRRDLGLKLLELMDDRAVRAIILTGAEGHFSAGADISHMAEVSIVQGRKVIETADHAVHVIVHGRKPVIAAVEGLAYGAGMSIALACDTIVAASDAKLSASFAKVGLVPDMGIMWTLAQRVGPARAKHILAFAQTLEMPEAERLGVVDKVVAPGATLDAARDIARQYFESGPMALALTKAAFANGVKTLQDAFRAEADYQPMLRRSDDHKEAVAAFMEKRKPTFKGT